MTSKRILGFLKTYRMSLMRHCWPQHLVWCGKLDTQAVSWVCSLLSKVIPFWMYLSSQQLVFVLCGGGKHLPILHVSVVYHFWSSVTIKHIPGYLKQKLLLMRPCWPQHLACPEYLTLQLFLVSGVYSLFALKGPFFQNLFIFKGSYKSGICQDIYLFSRSGNCQGILWYVREKNEIL